MAYKKEQQTQITTEQAVEKAKKDYRKDTKSLIEGYLYVLGFIIIMELFTALLKLPRVYNIAVMVIAFMLILREYKVIKEKVDSDTKEEAQ